MPELFTRSEQRSGATPGARSKDLPLRVLHKLECKACPLDKCAGLKHPKMAPMGEAEPDVYLLGEAPGAEDDASGKHFVGSAGQMLRKYIPPGWLDRIRFNNVIRTRPSGSRAPDPVEIECCRPSIIRDIEQSKPRAIFGFGGIPLDWATGVRNITNWRGRRLPVKIGNHICWYFPMLDPSFVNRAKSDRKGELAFGTEWESTFARDMKRAFASVDTLPVPTFEDTSRLDEGVVLIQGNVGDAKKIERALSDPDFYDAECVGIDLETNRKRPYEKDARILTVAISVGHKTLAFPLADTRTKWEERERREAFALVKQFLLSKRWTFSAHNAKFEMEWLAFFFGKEILFEVVWDDSQVQAYVLDPRAGAQSLNALTLIYFGFLIKEHAGTEIDRSDLEGRSQINSGNLGDVLRYNARDAKYAHKLRIVQNQAIGARNLTHVYEMQRRRIPTLAVAQLRGMLVDSARVTAYKQKNNEQAAAVHSELQALPVIEQYRRRFGAFNPLSPPDVLKMFRDVLNRPEIQNKTKRGISYTTDAEALSKIDLPLAKHILKLRGIDKMRSTYIDPLDIANKDSVVYADGYIHTNFNSTFTVSGRLCISGNSELETDLGIIAIEDLDLTCNVYRIRSHAGRWQRITDKWYKGRERMLRLEFDSGAYIECTPRHRILTPFGWVEAGSFGTGDVAIADPCFSRECNASESASCIRASQSNDWSASREVFCRVLSSAGSTESAFSDSHARAQVCCLDHQAVVSSDVRSCAERSRATKLRGFEDRQQARNAYGANGFTESGTRKFATSRIRSIRDCRSVQSFGVYAVSEPRSSRAASCTTTSEKLLGSDDSRAASCVGRACARLSRITTRLAERLDSCRVRLLSCVHSFGKSRTKTPSLWSESVRRSGPDSRSTNVLVDESRRNGDSTRASFTRIEVPSTVLSDFGISQSADRLRAGTPQTGDRDRWRAASGRQDICTRSCEGTGVDQEGVAGLSHTEYACSRQAGGGRNGDLQVARIIAIREIGVRDVWDITVETDHSYACQGLFHHNSSDDPNMQNFPKRKNPEMRAMVCAPPGYKLIAADYGQLEARLIACASRDPNLVDALWTNYDIHAEFAHLIAELVPDIVNRPAYKKNGVFDFKKLRHDAKNKVVFPLFYGSVAESVARDLIIAEPIAKKIATNFWKRFGGVQRWQHDVREFYAKHGYVECLTGRQRPGPLTQNMIINTPIQGTASDLVVDGMDRLARTSYEERIDHLTAALNIHDDLTFWVPEGEVESSIEQIVVHMLSADFDWLIVPISIEVSVGDNWYEMHEVGTFESHKLAS